MIVTTNFTAFKDLPDDFFDKFLGHISNGYYNIPASFDIETTSTYNHDEPVAFMYVWQVNISGYNVIGRTWNEFELFCQKLENGLCLGSQLRFVFYVHNLSYEFQYIRKHFHWIDTFMLDRRQPIKAVTDSHIEFRCSYILSGLRLETLAKNLTRYKVKKQVGKLDYNKVHTTVTPLTKDEIAYCLYDVIIVSCYIDEQLQKGYTIESLPMTKTGYVRRYMREKTDNAIYHKMIHKLQIKEQHEHIGKYGQLLPEIHEYEVLKQAFMGGYTHANVNKVGKVIEDVHSYDFTSSYPAVMLTEKYPCKSAIRVKIHTKEDFERINRDYLWIAKIEFHDLQSVAADDFLSSHKCITVDAVINNGRIHYAKECIVTLTSIDFRIMERAYTWNKEQGAFFIGDLFCYEMDYLPVDYICGVIELYQKKTTLKGVKGKEEEYQVAKGMLNSTYGMTVTDIVRDRYLYQDDEFRIEVPDLDKEILHYNYQKNRFIAYQWGVFITAYARYNLWTAILSIKDDYVYCDTDSIKFTNLEKHKDYFDTYNRNLWTKVEAMCQRYQLDPELLRPRTIKGKEKPIGVWDYEGKYKRFKTLGAKRYLVQDDKEYEITVAGLPKKNGVAYLLKHFPDDPFEGFTDGMKVPAAESGKLRPLYIDEEIEGVTKDYLGNISYYHELSSYHLEPTSFELTMEGIFKKLAAVGADFYVREMRKKHA